MEKKIAHLNIFLVKEPFSNNDQIINEKGCKDSIDITIPGCGKGQLYIKQQIGDYPKWSTIFTDYVDIGQIGNVANVSAALLVKVDDRYFVLAFGQGGRFLIRDGVYEERFGLLVALNSVDRESFRCIDKQSLDTIQSHTRIQSGHETSSDQFGLDVEQDMLKAIVGTPSDSRLGSRMTGMDSLSVSVMMDLSDLDFLLRSYKHKFNCDLSATDYQWVNNISIVKNSSSIITVLESKLLEKFAKKDHTNLWLSIPEIIQWDLVKGFIYTGGRKAIHSDINLSGFLGTLKDNQPITLDILKQRQVSCADEEHNKVFKSWSIYKCLYSEIDYEGNKYILNDGKWFSVNTDFVQKTNEDYAKINRSSLVLPEYYGGGEGNYNTTVADAYPNQYVLLDDKNKIFHGGGRGQVEICDLLSINKQLIHIKMYGKSSVLSHLFSQGFVSGQLLQLDAEFRKKVKNKLNSPFSDLIKVEYRPAENEFTVIFAVISESTGNELYLPFFSRVNLNNTIKILKGFGYKVELLKIRVNNRYGKKIILQPKKRQIK